MQESAELWKSNGDKMRLIVLGRQKHECFEINLFPPFPFFSLYVTLFWTQGRNCPNKKEMKNVLFFFPFYVHYLCKGYDCDNIKESRKHPFQDANTLSILKNPYSINFPKIYSLRRFFSLKPKLVEKSRIALFAVVTFLFPSWKAAWKMFSQTWMAHLFLNVASIWPGHTSILEWQKVNRP